METNTGTAYAGAAVTRLGAEVAARLDSRFAGLLVSVSEPRIDRRTAAYSVGAGPPSRLVIAATINQIASAAVHLHAGR